MKGKRGALSDLFIFMVFAVIILLVSGMFIYLGITTNSKLHQTMDKMSHDGIDYNKTISQTFGQVNVAYQSLYWISLFLIVAMILSIFFGSYMVTTRPVFFVPYIFIVIIAITVSLGISNAYTDLINQPELASTFSGFLGANYIMYYLPMWIAIIGFTGGIIMFVRMKSEEYVPYG